MSTTRSIALRVAPEPLRHLLLRRADEAPTELRCGSRHACGRRLAHPPANGRTASSTRPRAPARRALVQRVLPTRRRAEARRASPPHRRTVLRSRSLRLDATSPSTSSPVAWPARNARRSGWCALPWSTRRGPLLLEHVGERFAIPASTTNSRKDLVARSRAAAAATPHSLGLLSQALFLAPFFIGGSLSTQPREFPRGDLDRHFQFSTGAGTTPLYGLANSSAQ